MKSASGIIGGFVAVAILGAAAAWYFHKAEPRLATVPRGTEIPLILVRQLESGADPVDTPVPFMVAEDVRGPSGEVVVRKGALAHGKVVRSRGEGNFSGLVNQPARLDITITTVDAVDGRQLQLSAVNGGAPTEPLQLNRDNTGLPPNSDKLDKAWADPERQKDLVQFAELVQSGKWGDSMSADLVKRLSSSLNLDAVSKSAGSKADLDRVAGMVGKIAGGGGDLETIAKAGFSEVGAVVELVKAAGYVGNRLGQALKGRKIRAYIGMPIKGFVTEDAKVKPAGPEG